MTHKETGCWSSGRKKGKLTIDDIKEAATEYEEDYYGLVLKCVGTDGVQWFEDDLGDVAELYRITDVLEDFGRVKRL